MVRRIRRFLVQGVQWQQIEIQEEERGGEERTMQSMVRMGLQSWQRLQEEIALRYAQMQTDPLKFAHGGCLELSPLKLLFSHVDFS